jgi:amino acid transporter
MTPHFTMPLIMIPLLVLIVWRRVRSQFGPQPIRRGKMTLRIVVFAVLGCLSASYAIRDMHLLEGLVVGLATGVALGLAGLRLSQFRVDPVKGDCYVPNPYIGALVTVLFLGRLLWRLAMVSPQLRDPTGAAAPIHGPDIGQSPLTLALLGIFVGYYICYFAGLLIHHQRLLRSRPGQPV